MPKNSTRRKPKLCHHKGTGLAYVNLNGKRVYLGKWGSEEAERRYHTTVAEWLAHGRRLPVAKTEITVVELFARYLEYAEGYYVLADGSPSRQLDRIRTALKVATELYGATPASEFGPVRLRIVRDRFVERGHCRTNINALVGCIKRAFKWGASWELIPGAVVENLNTLEGLRRGRTTAPEGRTVEPVPDEHVEAVRPYVSSVVWAMIELQRLTGARPAEILGLRPCDIDMSGPVWIVELDAHKTAYKGRRRTLLIGPRGQAVLRPLLLRPADAYLFSPRESNAEQHRKDAAGARRPGQRPNPTRTDRRMGERYDTHSYRQAIARACKRARVPVWTPNQLRHSMGTRLRREYGLDVAQAVLGHARADVTQVYAQLDLTKAAAVIAEIG